MSERDVIEGARAAFVNAFNSENAEAMASLLTDDHISMPPNRPSLRGTDESVTFWREKWTQAASKLAIGSEQLKITSDVAVDQFRWTMDSTPRSGGNPVHDEGKCVWVWRRQSDGSWKLARCIWNSDLSEAGLWSGAAAGR